MLPNPLLACARQYQTDTHPTTLRVSWVLVPVLQGEFLDFGLVAVDPLLVDALPLVEGLAWLDHLVLYHQMSGCCC